MFTVPTHTHPTPHTLTPPRWREVVQHVADFIHGAAAGRAWEEGLTLARVGLTGREYRSPLFGLGVRDAS